MILWRMTFLGQTLQVYKYFSTKHRVAEKQEHHRIGNRLGDCSCKATGQVAPPSNGWKTEGLEPQNLTFDQKSKSKLSIAFLTIPLLAEFQIPVKHYKDRIYFSGGFYGGLRIESHTKIKYRLEGKKEKLKTPAIFAAGL